MGRYKSAIVRSNCVFPGDSTSVGSTGIRVGSPEWEAWLADRSGFRFEGSAGHLTARREMRRGMPYWYGYRRIAGRLRKVYLGKTADLTPERLEQASWRLSEQAKMSRLSESSRSLDWLAAPGAQSAVGGSLAESTVRDLSFLPLTKIRAPALPQKLVTRERLTRRITGSITLVVAPSGFGKSTLLNEWRQSCGIPVAWVSLDGDDNQAQRFWSTVIAALRSVYPNLGRDPQSSLPMPSPVDPSKMITYLTNALIQAGDVPDFPGRLGLVLDDYHHIEDKSIHDSLQTWLDRLPPTLQVVISSQTRPPLALARWRARGIIVELGTDDLRFTLEEATEYLSKHIRGYPLALADVQGIIEGTEGWAAGLALAALAIDRPSHSHQPPATFTGAHSYVREYFIENVLRRQPTAVQDFLLKTAILKHLTGSLCDAVTGRSDGADMLSRLWEENLFLVRMEEPNWYRYHHLFAEALFSELQQRLGGEVPWLHRRAAEWYRAHGAPDDAVHHLLVTEAWGEAASLIEEIVLHELEHSGDYSRVFRWLRQLPAGVVQQHSTLLRVYARMAALALSRDEVKNLLADAETNITGKPTADQTAEEQSVLAEVRRIRRFWITGEPEFPILPGDRERHDVWRLLDGMVTYARYVRCNCEKAEKVARELYDLARMRSHLYSMLIAGGAVAYFAVLRGQLRRAERIAGEVLQHALGQCGKLPESASAALTVLGQVSYERNQLDRALQLLTHAAEVDPNPTSSNMPVMEAILRAKIEFAEGRAGVAQATIQGARELLSRYPAGLYRDQDLVAYQAWFRVRQGDCADAEQLLSQSATGKPHAFLTFVRAELCLAQGELATAADLLQRLIRDCPHGLYLESNLGARVSLALALFQQHQLNQARHVMTEAVRLAAPEDLCRVFLDRGPKGLPLLTLVLHTSNLSSDTRAFVTRALRLMGESSVAHVDGLEADLTTLSAAASITEREQQVLRLLSAGLSNREIASQMSLSESTVKTHLKNIFRKLGVSSRTKAIAQSRALRLA